MPANFAKVTWVMMESLRSLLNKLQFASYFDTSLSREYKQSIPVGETIYPKLPWRPLIRDGMEYSPTSINRLTTPITMDQVFGSDFDIDAVDKVLNMERGEELVKKEYIEPCINYLAQELESRAMLYAYQNTPNIVGALGTTPTAITTFHQARQKLVENACPPGDWGMFISPAMNTTLGTNLTTVMHPSKELGDLFKTGMLGNASGFKWFESMSLYDHQAGTMTVGDCTVTTTLTNGATSVGITSASAAVAWKKGDIISFTTPMAVNPMTRRSTAAAKTFVLTQDMTIAAGGGTGTAYFYPAVYGPGNPYQNVDILPTAAHVVVQFPGTSAPTGLHGINGMALSRDAFALVSVPLSEPKSVEVAKTVRDPQTGISISLVSQFEGRTRNTINRLDILCGFGKLYAENCSVRVASLL